MNKTKSYTIQLLNKSYEIKCPENEEESLKLAAQQLNNQVLKNKKKFKQLDDFQALLLAALHISHELITSQTRQEEHQNQLNQFIKSLENKINQAGIETSIAESEK